MLNRPVLNEHVELLLWHMSTPVRVSNSLLSCDERSERPSREERREELSACP